MPDFAPAAAADALAGDPGVSAALAVDLAVLAVAAGAGPAPAAAAAVPPVAKVEVDFN